MWTRPTDRNSLTSRLTLHSLVTPAPLHRRRNTPDTILTSIHLSPSLRAWLAPLFHPRRADNHDDDDNVGQEDLDEDYLEDRQDLPQQMLPPSNSLRTNGPNLNLQLDQLLLYNYDDTFSASSASFESRQLDAVDVLQDSARVAHQVADVLTDFEVQSAGQRKSLRPTTITTKHPAA